MNDGDWRSRKRHVGIQGLQPGIIPISDLSQEDVRKHGPGEPQTTSSYPFDIHHRNDASDDQRELTKAGLSQFLWPQRHVGSTEIDRACLYLLQARAGPVRLIVNLVASLGLILRRPFRKDGEHEGRSRAARLRRLRWQADSQKKTGHCRIPKSLAHPVPPSYMSLSPDILTDRSRPDK